MCQVIAGKMLQTLKSCTLYARATATFERSAARGDCDAMWAYFNRCIKQRPDVGGGIRRSGGKPIESVEPDMRRLYEEHGRHARAGNR